MEKMQILFPEPQLVKLRNIAKLEDRPVSELVRTAVDFWLSRRGSPGVEEVRESPPVYGCGKIIAGAEAFRETAWQARVEKNEQS